MNSDNRKKTMVIYLNSETMGRGNDELGALLMGNFLLHLGESGDISHILLVNSAVKMACSGSDQVEAMQMLQAAFGEP